VGSPASRETRLADAFVSLADALVTGYDVVDLLHSLIGHCLDLVDATAGGLVLRDATGALEVLASSSEDVRLLELLQLREGEGPCVECYESGRLVTIDDLFTEDSPWPSFQASARADGIRSVHAVPMRLQAETIGAMNLFSTKAGPLPDADAKVVRALTDVATIAILQERALRQGDLVRSQLQGALDSRIIIEQAKGVLAQMGDLGMDAAFRLLRSYARGSGARLSDVAAGVVAGTLARAVLLGRTTSSVPSDRV
jgi:GAF domain-containing protein